MRRPRSYLNIELEVVSLSISHFIALYLTLSHFISKCDIVERCVLQDYSRLEMVVLNIQRSSLINPMVIGGNQVYSQY